ncbi:hypothetical protein FQR65_LT00350 [Abscondita terminalis]|nr:hypothetical protein FQR65_LT00350 [Abscondita terminalis]
MNFSGDLVKCNRVCDSAYETPMLSYSPMLLMPNSSRSSSPGPRRGPPTNYGTSSYSPLNLIGTSQHLRPSLSWASVASWFFRPSEPLPLTTVANNDQLSPNSTTSSRPLVPSTRISTPLAKPPETSAPRPSPAAASALHREERTDRERVFQPPTICTAIKCTVPNCSCDSFVPGKRHLRYCETCKHGWVPHALDKLGTRHLFTNSAPEPVQPNVAFDIASLVLYGCQALPIRLKILFDRLFSVLQKEQVLQILHGFGWTPDDYARGYMLQEAHGSTLDRWSICSPEEEPLVLQQFLRFGETRAITQQLLLAQQALHQESTLERLGHRPSSNPRRAMSPNRRPSPPTFSPSAFHPSWLPTMSPHQKQSLNFLKMPSLASPVSSPSKNIYGANSITSSPLNRLQNMQPFDFRKLGAGLAGFSCQPNPDLSMRRKVSESDTPGSLNLSISTSLPMCPPPLPSSSLPTSLNHSAAAMAAAVSANSLAAASLVASSFSSLMSTGLGAGSKSPCATEPISAGGSSEIGSEDDDNDNSHSALNLSRDKDPNKSLRQPRPVSGRKPITPTKRQWGSPGLPLNLGTQFINPATGKKRVQCNVCLKTFCDKGALKIHFSAVHLREMHKCTVEGCNMMFSSRRSRNRHSANPNPKLHSPHLRRKISPHDGRSAQPHPMLLPSQPGLSLPATALNSLNPFGPFPILTPPPDIRHHTALTGLDFKQSLDLSINRAGSEEKSEEKQKSYDSNVLALTTTSSSNHEDDDDYDDDGIVVVGGDEDEDSERIDCSNGISDLPEDFSMPSKRFKMSVSDVDEDVGSNGDSNEDSVSIVDTHSLKDELNLSTNKRKRKSQNPTKCSVPLMTDDGVSDGESSNDLYSERNVDKQEFEKEGCYKSAQDVNNSKLNYLQDNDDMPINFGKNTSDVNANESESGVYSEIKTSIAPLYPTEKLKKEKQCHDSENTEDNDRPASTVESNKSDESFDSSNALRHLESLSHGNFGDLMAQGMHLGLGVPNTHLAPLGFMMGGGPPSPARSQASSGGSSNGPDSPDESSQNQLFGLFDNGQFISTMDVPIDKDNPRRCAACGKIFQNHFGVKTHYQNVHLKLMHKCNVDGCNAAFPSKRSRDRHSANLNLHRKLLSTSADKGSSFLEKSHFPSLANNPALQGDFFARLYAEEALKNHHIPGANLNQIVLNGDRIPPPPFLLPPLGGLPFPLGSFNHFSHLNGSSALTRRERSSASNSPTPASPPPTSSSPEPISLIHSVNEDLPVADEDGNLPCRFCKTNFNNPVQLKEHCESNHLLDMFKCKVVGCPKVFMSRTKRNLHSENASLHQHILNIKKEQKENVS